MILGKIRIDNLELHAHHGFHAHEASFGQHFALDMELEYDMEAAALQDSFKEAVDYGAVLANIHSSFVERKYTLLETSAFSVCHCLFEEFPKLQSIFLWVKKLNPPLKEHLNSVGIELFLTRAQWEEINLA